VYLLSAHLAGKTVFTRKSYQCSDTASECAAMLLYNDRTGLQAWGLALDVAKTHRQRTHRQTTACIVMLRKAVAARGKVITKHRSQTWTKLFLSVDSDFFSCINVPFNSRLTNVSSASTLTTYSIHCTSISQNWLGPTICQWNMSMKTLHRHSIYINTDKF